MAYRISYQSIGKTSKFRSQIPWRKLCILCAALLCIGALLVGRNAVMRWMLPGDPEVTGRALQTMIESLQSGTGLADAWTAFCKEIIAYGIA